MYLTCRVILIQHHNQLLGKNYVLCMVFKMEIHGVSYRNFCFHLQILFSKHTWGLAGLSKSNSIRK